MMLPGHLIFRVAAGHPFEHVSSHRDVRLRSGTASTRFDRGPIDRVIARHSGALQVSRAFTSRKNVGEACQRHRGWDAIEEEIGLSRTFRLQVDRSADIHALVSDLAALNDIEMAAPQVLARAPLAAPALALESSSGAVRDARSLAGCDEALAMEPGDSALIIGLVDSGVALGHPELGGRLRPGVNTVSASELAEGVELLSGQRASLQDIADDQGHGTECASILCGNGFRIPRGLAGASRLLAVRSLCGARVADRATPTAIGSLPDIDSGVKTAIDLGARVLNLSFGTPEDALGPYDCIPHIEVVRYALERDCVLVVASGNGGNSLRYYPAALPGVIAVGSVDRERLPSQFTSRGAHVALSAPGERLACAGISFDGYARVSGTSFAAPLVTAACALMLARAARQSTALSATTVRSLLVESASPFGRGSDHQGCGAGILDVPAALRAVDAHCGGTEEDWSQALSVPESGAPSGAEMKAVKRQPGAGPRRAQ